MTPDNLLKTPAKSIRINPHRAIRNHSVYIIAEMACAHDGSYSKAEEMIDVAAMASADAVQLQFFEPASNMVKRHKLYPVLEEIAFDATQWSALVERARSLDLDVFACAYDMPSLDLAIQLQVDGIKFNSADLSNYEMIQRVASSGIPFTLGTGASRMDEVGEAVSTALKHGSDKFILMHGMQSFPTSIEQANLLKIPALKTMFNSLVGYADHTSGKDLFAQDIDLIAVGLGACVFEKHYTLDRSLEGLDSQAALEPDELKRFVEKLRSASLAVGSAITQKFNTAEQQYRIFQKKRIVAARDLVKGTTIARDDVELLRTEDMSGLEAGSLDLVLGKKLLRDVSFQRTLLEQDLA